MRAIHTHVSATTIFYVFVGVLVAGTFWRFGSGYLVKQPPGTFANALGKAMAVQF